jgi:acyl CoA:acetate/3-ketoacid CoA transferase beta subunit
LSIENWELMNDYTVDELICACIARQIEDGEVVAQGIATPLVAAGYILAKLTQAPNVAFVSAIGHSICYDWAPLSLSHIENLWLGRATHILSFAQIACTVLPTFSPREFFRPAQIDSYGNFNNVVIGDYQALRPGSPRLRSGQAGQALRPGSPRLRSGQAGQALRPGSPRLRSGQAGQALRPGSGQAPRLRLPGCGGIADVTAFSHRIYLYVPRHERRTFVERLDFCSGIGFLSGEEKEERQRRGITSPGPHYLVSDLGQFDYAHGRMRLISCHPGVSVTEVQAQTGFPLEVAPDVTETPPPTQEQVRLLREEIDPLGVRRLECLSGKERRAVLREIVKREETSAWTGPSN